MTIGECEFAYKITGCELSYARHIPVPTKSSLLLWWYQPSGRYVVAAVSVLVIHRANVLQSYWLCEYGRYGAKIVG